MRKTFRFIILASVAVSLLTAGLALAAGPDGKALYDSKCALCHGKDGVAKEMWAKKGAHNFNDAAWQKAKSDEVISKTINEGVPDHQMPSYKEKLKPEEIAAIVKYIRTLGPSK